MSRNITVSLDPKTVSTAQAVQKMYGSNYYTATLLLPRSVRRAVFVFYAFVRLADEIVDNPETKGDVLSELDAYGNDWRECYRTGISENDIFLAFRDVCLQYKIEYQLTEDFLWAMRQDTIKSRYTTYEELQGYVYGSAEVIGIILTKLFGCTNHKALPYAKALGSAMQLTNFLRDIKEDYELRDRVYIPQEDLAAFSVSEMELVTLPSSERVRNLMKFEINRAHDLFNEALAGVSYLPSSVQPAVRAAAALYCEILKEIERQNYVVPAEKIRFGTLTKIRLAVLYGYVKK